MLMLIYVDPRADRISAADRRRTQSLASLACAGHIDVCKTENRFVQKDYIFVGMLSKRCLSDE